jgi:hypothetical protein
MNGASLPTSGASTVATPTCRDFAIAWNDDASMVTNWATWLPQLGPKGTVATHVVQQPLVRQVHQRHHSDAAVRVLLHVSLLDGGNT